MATPKRNCNGDSRECCVSACSLVLKARCYEVRVESVSWVPPSVGLEMLSPREDEQHGKS